MPQSCLFGNDLKDFPEGTLKYLGEFECQTERCRVVFAGLHRNDRPAQTPAWKLPSKMSERFVCLRHPVDVFAFGNCRTFLVEGTEKF